MTDDVIARAGAVLRGGALVGLPTETVYGLAADATSDHAVARIFEAKGRPRFNPLIVHVADIADIDPYAVLSDQARRLAEAFWPGPLTLVLPRAPESGLSLLVSAGLDTVAVRVPAHEVARAIIAAAGCPLAAPSANRSGTISPTTAQHVRDGLGARVALVVDGGPSVVGLESTIIKLDAGGGVLLRPGGIARAQIEDVLGAPLQSHSGGIEAPGMMTSHYAPRVAMRLAAHAPDDDEFFLGFGERAGTPGLNLSERKNLTEAAANLFAFLRQADQACAEQNLRAIAVAPIPEDGLGEAINDRLRRAAAPRAPLTDSTLPLHGFPPSRE